MDKDELEKEFAEQINQLIDLADKTTMIYDLRLSGNLQPDPRDVQKFEEFKDQRNRTKEWLVHEYNRLATAIDNIDKITGATLEGC